MISARLLVPSLLLGFATTASAQVTVGTGAPPAGTSYWVADHLRADGFTQAWGQSFRAPDATNVRLDSWSFWVNGYYENSGYGSLSMRLEIVEWPGTCGVNCTSVVPLGPSLYTSANTVTPAPGTTPQQFVFDVGLTLDPTRIYLAFLRPVSYTPPSNGTQEGLAGFYYQCNPIDCGTGVAVQNYDGGGLVNLWTPTSQYDPATNTYKYADLSVSAAVYDYGTYYDTRFDATFAPTTVPEPATLSLLGIGLAGAAMARRRRK